MFARTTNLALCLLLLFAAVGCSLPAPVPNSRVVEVNRKPCNPDLGSEVDAFLRDHRTGWRPCGAVARDNYILVKTESGKPFSIGYRGSSLIRDTGNNFTKKSVSPSVIAQLDALAYKASIAPPYEPPTAPPPPPPAPAVADPEITRIPDVPNEPEPPRVPDTPREPVVPKVTGEPAPDVPRIPDVPVPTAPSTPKVPAPPAPVDPPTPPVPDVPTPADPALPPVPDAPAPPEPPASPDDLVIPPSPSPEGQ